MKKFFTMMVSIAVAIALLSGCGGAENTANVSSGGEVVETETDTQQTKDTQEIEVGQGFSIEKSTAVAEVTSVDDFMTWVEDKIDTSKYKISDPTDKSVHYNLEYEHRTEYNLDDKILLGDGTTINALAPVTNLVDQGWKPNKDSDMDVELKSGYSTSNLFKKDDVKLTVYSVNRSDLTATYGDGDMHRILFDLYSSNDKYGEPLSSGPDFTICESINNGSSLDDVISLLGDPISISYSIIGDKAYAYIQVEYSNREKLDYLRLRFNADGSKIVNVDCDWDVRE